MSGIAGVCFPGNPSLVERMLGKLAHRGSLERIVLNVEGATLGVGRSGPRVEALVGDRVGVQDYAGEGHFARARRMDGKLVLERDPLGVAPLYHGRTQEGGWCFASEVKALQGIAREIDEVPAGCRLDGRTVERVFDLQEQEPLRDEPGVVAAELRRRLESAVKECLGQGSVGAWLSGGLDSSALVALARPQVERLHTFSVGLPGSPDLEYARVVADFIQSDHHEITVRFEDMLAILPVVIYHLESFDALLVRSSIMNFRVGRISADHVRAVFSGEGGDELFAGYEYLKSLPREALSGELIDITRRLHNTALQRVDRSASAHGLTAHVCFLHPPVVDYALRIPVEYKLRNGVEKWILREAMAGLLPDSVLKRQKSKFWEGTGVGERLSEHADRAITDAEFNRERAIPNGWTLRSKEELMYYRIFKDHFGDLPDLGWMGRTKETSGSA